MSKEIFVSYGYVDFKGVQLNHILKRVKVIKRALEKYRVFFDYVIKDGERPDTVAFDYYGSEEYAWLIMIANDIYDPYYNWPLTGKQFYSYMVTKYGDYFQTQVDIHHYEFTGVPGVNTINSDIVSVDPQYQMTPTTFNTMTAEQKSGWTPVTIFDYEDRLNESKRKIRLISNDFIDQIDREVRQLFS